MIAVYQSPHIAGDSNCTQLAGPAIEPYRLVTVRLSWQADVLEWLAAASVSFLQKFWQVLLGP